MRKAQIIGVLLIIMVLVLGACSPTTTTTPPPTTTATPTPTQGVNKLGVFEFFFSLESITVPVGTTVTWNHMGVEGHTVTSDDDLFNWDLAPSESFSYTFTEPGTFSYHCIYHEDADMKGTVIVE